MYRGFLGWQITWYKNFFDPSIFDPYRPPGQNRLSEAYFGSIPVLVRFHVLPIVDVVTLAENNFFKTFVKKIFVLVFFTRLLPHLPHYHTHLYLYGIWYTTLRSFSNSESIITWHTFRVNDTHHSDALLSDWLINNAWNTFKWFLSLIIVRVSTVSRLKAA